MRSVRSGTLVVTAVGVKVCLVLGASSALAPRAVEATNMVYIAVTPCRVAQTTVAGGIITAGSTRAFAVLGPATNYAAQGGNAAGCGIPALGEVEAVFFNFVAQNPAGPGNLKAWAGDGSEPSASTINYQLLSPNLNVANGVAVPVRTTAPAGADLNVKASFSNVHVVIDVVGYFAPLNKLQDVGGLGNTALGKNALPSSTTGINNTAVGMRALGANTTGYSNTASGVYALRFNTTGNNNTASGYYALRSNTTGDANTAVGMRALRSNGTGNRNTASGADALRDNTMGYGNTASGKDALRSNTTGVQNTASGTLALANNTLGLRNTALGYQAGYLTTGSANIAIGNSGRAAESNTIRLGNAVNHLKTFIAGIRGTTTGVADAVAVLIDSNGQLGTLSSSRRLKEEIADLGESSERLFALRPVSFRYKPEVQQGERPVEYGLIAEEVAEVFPELVVYGKDGEPETVRYHVLVPLLLNELQKERSERTRESEEQRIETARLRRERDKEVDSLRSELADEKHRTQSMLTRLTALENGFQSRKRSLK